MREGSIENITTIGTISDFKKRIDDATNNFAALRLQIKTSSYEEIMPDIRNEELFIHFEDYLAKRRYILSPEIKKSQQEVINQYNNFIDKVLEAKDIKELKEVGDEAYKYLKEVSK